MKTSFLKKYIVLFSIIIITTECRKDEISIPIEIEQLPSEINVEAILYKAPYIYAAGGTFQHGEVYRKHIDSSKWDLILETNRKINDIADYNDHLLFVGDSVFAATYNVTENTWNGPFYYSYFEPWPKTISNFKKIGKYENNSLLISELNQIAGNIYSSADTCRNQYMRMQEDNGLYSITFFAPDSALICGYGQLFAVNVRNWEQNIRNITDEIFTSLTYNEGITLLCSFSGNIYKSSDNGNNWSSSYTPSKQDSRKIKLNEILLGDNTNAYAIGEKGTILFSGNRGDSWTKIKNSCTEKLLSITAVNNYIFIGGSKGTILRMDADLLDN